MILLIDNYDSFTYNLYQFIGIFNSDIKVVRNDKITIEEIEELDPESIVVSPGPKSPKDAGICVDVIKHFTGKKPILGICLGHQCIGEAFGATVSYAKCIMHGKQSVRTRRRAACATRRRCEASVGGPSARRAGREYAGAAVSSFGAV